MNIGFRTLLLASSLVALGCGEGSHCLAACGTTATFILNRPATAERLRITVEPGGKSLTCSRADSESMVCDGDYTDLHPVFGQSWALDQVEWLYPPADSRLSVAIEVDGEPYAAGAFDYHPRTVAGPCSDCLESANFRLE